MTTEIRKHTNIILIAGGINSGTLIPRIGLFKALGTGMDAYVQVESIEAAMRQFKFHVLLDTTIARQVYPYNNGIVLKDGEGEIPLIEQSGHFDYLSYGGNHHFDNYIYKVAPSVLMRNVNGMDFSNWATIEEFSSLYQKTSSPHARELMENLLHVLSTPKQRKS